METNFSDYVIERGGLIVCEPCISINLFSDKDLSSPGAPSVLGPYEAFLKIFAGKVRYCLLSGDQMHPLPVTPDRLRQPFIEMQDDKRRKKAGVFAEYFDGKSRDENRPPSFLLHYTKIYGAHTAIRLNMPLAWFEAEGSSGIQNFLEEALADFPLQAGYVGYGVSWAPNAERELSPIFSQWLQRHPGLGELGVAHILTSHFGIPAIGWMTLLGEEYVERLGGADVLNKAVSKISGATSYPLPQNGISIRLDELPVLGDVQSDDTLSNYKDLGILLGPLRNNSKLIESMAVTGIDDDAARVRWIKRFFPD